MAMIRGKVEGARELGERMRKLATKGALSIAGAMTGAAANVIKVATVRNIVSNESSDKSNPGTTVDQGNLRDAVIVKKVPKSEAEFTSEHIVTFRGRGKPYNKKGQKIARAPHAHLTEFGTVKMDAEPALRPAFDSEQGKAARVMIERGRKRLDKVLAEK